MFDSPTGRLRHFVGGAVICTAVWGGCKRLDPPISPPAADSPALPAPAAATEIAPASRQYVAVSEVPVPTPAPAPRTHWPVVKLSDGRVFERVRVSAEEGAYVTLLHAGGIAKVDKRTLPPELAAMYPYNSEAAAAEAQAAAARRHAAAVSPVAPARSVPLTPTRTVRPVPATQPATVSTAAIEHAVKARARRYFETEKRLGSGQTLAFDVLTDLSEPREVSGWAHRWEITGTAGYKVYESVGWGSFSKRTTKFTAIVEMPPGKRPVVVSFDERS